MKEGRPDPSKEYAVVLGETFQRTKAASYHSLQYKFKPQSAGRSGPGKLDIADNTVRHFHENGLSRAYALLFQLQFLLCILYPPNWP